MPWKPVDAAVVMTTLPLIDDTDFKSPETAVAYDAAGMSVSLFQETADGTTVTTITLTSGGANDWTHKAKGCYEIEVTAAQNDTKCVAWIEGNTTGVLPWSTPKYDIISSARYAELISGAGNIGDAALVAIKLDRLIAIACAGGDVTAEVVDDSIMAKVMATNGIIANFDGAIHALQGIAEALALQAPFLFAPHSDSSVTTGDEDATSYLDAATLGGGVWTIGDEDGANTIDVIAVAQMGAAVAAFSVEVTGYYNGSPSFQVEVEAWNFLESQWDTFSDGSPSNTMTHRATNTTISFALLGAHTDTVTTPGEVRLRFRSTRTTTQAGDILRLDQIVFSGAAAGTISPEVYADAVAAHVLFQTIKFLQAHTVSTLYVNGATGSDSNDGDLVVEPLATIAAAITKATAGTSIIISRGTYAEAGLNLDVNSVHMKAERGVILTGGGGTALVVSANYCRVDGLEITPAAGEIGLQITGEHSCFDFITTHGGTSGIQLTTTATENILRGCNTSDYTVAGFDVQGGENKCSYCVARGNGATKGFYLSHDDAECNVFTMCLTISNSGAGWETIVGADNNTFAFCVDSADDGARVDAGAGNVWRFFGNADVAAANVTAMAAGVITAAAHATDSIAADAIAAGAVTKIQAGLATLAALGTHDDALAVVDALVDAIKAKTDNLPAFPAATGDQMDLVDAPNPTAVTAIQITLAKTGGGADTLETLSAQIDAIASGGDATLAKQEEILATIAALPDDTDIAALQTILDRLNTTLEESGANYRFTAAALAQAPTGGGRPGIGV